MKSYLLIPLLLLGLLGSGFVSPPRKAPVQVMLLGTHYLPADILRQSRQRELKEVVETILPFGADRILLPVGINSRQAESLNQHLADYQAGRHPLNRSVEEQIGLRLAASFGHDQVYGYMQAEGFCLNEGGEELARFQEQARALEYDKLAHSQQTDVLHYLSYLNHPNTLEKEHSIYIQHLSHVGAGIDYQGADMLAEWYSYHLRMFANVTDRTEGAERIIVLLDSRYIPIMQDLLKADPDYEAISVEDFFLAK